MLSICGFLKLTNNNIYIRQTLEEIIQLGESIIAQEGGGKGLNATHTSFHGGDSGGGRHGFGTIRGNSGYMGGRSGQKRRPEKEENWEEYKTTTPPANARYFNGGSSSGTRDNEGEREVKSALLGEDSSPRKSVRNLILFYLNGISAI